MGYQERRPALAALGVRLVVGKASDCPRWRITMEIDAADASSVARKGGDIPNLAPDSPAPLVLQWTDQDETQPMAAD